MFGERKTGMTEKSQTTLRLHMPQWQGGNNPAYHFGSLLLSFLAPRSKGPEETVPVPIPLPGETLDIEKGIVGRQALLAQAKAARRAIEKHQPDRIVALGGDCLIDLAPIAYLNKRYCGKLGILWIDSHPDVMVAEHYGHAHAHVLGMLLGRGDPAFVAKVDTPVDPRLVMYAGLDSWMDIESEVIDGLGLSRCSSAQVSESSAPILEWIKKNNIEQVAVHFDLDALDPAQFRPLLFNKPNQPADFLAGVPRGRLTPSQVVRLLRDVSGACEIVGLAIAEHLPWDTMAMRDMLAELPILSE
jgi:arginase